MDTIQLTIETDNTGYTFLRATNDGVRIKGMLLDQLQHECSWSPGEKPENGKYREYGEIVVQDNEIVAFEKY